ncbi:hypothetical protein BZA05DRAFT_418276 [Tricharina praecox]|uniref:uncharacterized protein n=1 Tax=Tricharina praecox TaxID=43433 RepID=UPI00221FDF83|nr:uncharacterized protein BZA05DRAFT_418276 [Tricharina praecox]KAI5853492.1 hypothetical protein BZA05DRAFT_418276 [Tricharina praecox]
MFVLVSTIRGWGNTDLFSRAIQHVLRPYFEGDEFYNRKWDLYHYETSVRDFFLLPIDQAQEFLKDLSEQTGITKGLLDPPNKLAFFISPEAAQEEPKLIGSVSSKEEFNKLVAAHSWSDEVIADRKKKEKVKKARKKKEKQSLAMMGYNSSVRTARQHLGLGMKACAMKEAAGEGVSEDRPRPVLVAIDVEAWEQDHNQITEIGIATLDTALIPSAAELPALSLADMDMANIDYDNPAPKTRASVINELIKCRHLRIHENRSLRNGIYVSDAADKFDFGESEWVSLGDVPAILGESLRFFDENGNKRNVIIVGHDVKQDLAYLRITGYDVWNIKDLEVMDTTAMYKAVNDVHESRGLGRVLTDMGVIFWNLHNAGNDAAYTLQAFVCLADRGLPPYSHQPASPVAVPAEDEIPPATLPEPKEGEYPDYEDLVESGCISYIDPAKNQLGPRPKSGKKGGRARANRDGFEPPQEPKRTVTAQQIAEVEDGWGTSKPVEDDVW